MAKICSQSENFSRWYLDLVKEADLIDYAPVKGCMIFKPYAYKIWELIKEDLDQRIKNLGVDNAYFPMLIPESFIIKEKEHLEGFAPELLTATRVGQKKLEEDYVLRPTSETIIYDAYSRWIESYRDLPLKMNQWANVFRWELKTKPFLRTSEFLWQEGHTVHKDNEDAAKMVEDALNMYYEFQKEILAIDPISGKKSPAETFPGADYTYTLEVLAKDKKTIQSCTSHNLGQSFAEAFNISFTDEDEKIKTPYLTSWGMTTRIIGTLIMAHGDDKGLCLPPKIAPYQVVIIPILNKKDDEKVLEKTKEIEQILKEQNIRYKTDLSDKRPGFKFAEWELKGVPVRLELGARDLENNSCVLCLRKNSEKINIKITDLKEEIPKIFVKIHQLMLDDYQNFLKENIIEVETKEEAEKIIKEKGGFVKVNWCLEKECEESFKSLSTAKCACIPLKQEKVKGKCFNCGKEAKVKALFAKSY
jgi:prolyl-tRNA synthetase